MRLLHPRHPAYVVPRGDGRFMIGATMLENEEAGRITARAMLELLGAAYCLHPAFAEAEIVETGAGVRPAFPDNLPKIRRDGRKIYVNGLYRHGFLLAPALARRAVQAVLKTPIFRRSWMRIHVNGKALEVAAATLGALLRELDYEDGAIATALNQNFVRKTDRGKTPLKEGDTVEILVPRQGG